MISEDNRIAIVQVAHDSDKSELPFGKRWNHETLTLKAEHMEALRRGQLLAIDVQSEYVVYLKLEAAIDPSRKELGYGG